MPGLGQNRASTKQVQNTTYEKITRRGSQNGSRIQSAAVCAGGAEQRALVQLGRPSVRRPFFSCCLPDSSAEDGWTLARTLLARSLYGITFLWVRGRASRLAAGRWKARRHAIPSWGGGCMALHAVLLCESIIVHFFIKTESLACSRSSNISSSLLGNVIQVYIIFQNSFRVCKLTN